MKKKLFLHSIAIMMVSMLCVNLSSCGSDDDSNELELTVSPESVSLHYEETVQLQASDNVNTWMSENEFVATVNSSGYVTGGHVGTTRIKAAQGSRVGYSTITIVPKYNLYDTPITEFGATKATIKGMETHELSGETETSLLYRYTVGTHPCLVMYNLKSGRLDGIMAMLKYSDFVTAGYHLLERYQAASKTDDLFIFLNNNSPETATMAVTLGTQVIDGSTITAIVYMPWPLESSMKRRMPLVQDDAQIQSIVNHFFK